MGFNPLTLRDKQVGKPPRHGLPQYLVAKNDSLSRKSPELESYPGKRVRGES